ncbi:Ig-like domain-containing protein [Eggerthella sp. YY7918]|uniref:Ig-like domain-containing protein n=1 Tax=Eggerthella sp. (strain YY7918) TaxID=502558 RepID=UPI000217119B|nr:Ig-like domain-containing protein [Eggerthella sp. YY7918]BAK45772.1 hypothetical protein EGYY_27800 [Eggerthella sp. YY7918]
MLEKILDLKNTFEGKFLAVLMSVVLVFGMSNFAAFAEGDAGDSTSTPTEQPDPASEDLTSTPPAPDPNGETPGEQQVIQGTVQHGAEAGTNSGGVVVPPPAESNEVDEAVVTFETENAYVSVNDQTFSTPTITTLTTKLHKELKFVASPDTGFEIESVKAKNAAVAEVPITTQDGISTIAGDYVDSTLVITVKAKAVETNVPQANETTPIEEDTVIKGEGTPSVSGGSTRNASGDAGITPIYIPVDKDKKLSANPIQDGKWQIKKGPINEDSPWEDEKAGKAELDDKDDRGGKVKVEIDEHATVGDQYTVRYGKPGNYKYFYIIVGDSSAPKPSLSISGPSSVMVGDTITLTARTTNIEGDVTWTSSDKTIATVDSNGVVTGVKKGTVLIHAEAGGLAKSKRITVSRDESNGHYVYLYAKATGDTEGLVLNSQGWYTVGRVWVSDIVAPDTYPENRYYTSGSEWDQVMNALGDPSNIERFSSNASIDIANIKWNAEGYGLKNALRATGYDETSNDRYWHLDGKVDVTSFGEVKINHYEVGTTNEVHPATADTANAGTVVNNTSKYKQEIDGYRFVSADPVTYTFEKGKSGTINLYYKKGDFDYTVHYYKSGTTEQVADDKIDTAEYGAQVTESAIDVRGYTKVEPTEQTIKIDVTGNEIIFYYDPIPTYNVTYTTDGNGKVSNEADNDIYVTGTEGISGSTATANDTYRFEGWYVGASADDPNAEKVLEATEELTPDIAAQYILKDGEGRYTNTVFTAKFEKANTSIAVEKKWVGADGNEPELKPEVKIQLLQNGQPYKDEGAVATLVSGEVNHVFKDVPRKDANGKLYTYSDAEVQVGNTPVSSGADSVQAEIDGVEGKVKYGIAYSGDAEKGFVVTNTTNSVLLTISKSIVDETIAKEESLAQTFDVTVGDMGPFSLGNGDTKTLAVEKGKTYTVSEDANSATWKPTYTINNGRVIEGKSAKVTADKDTTVAFTNTRIPQRFYVKKMWATEHGSTPPATLNYTVHMSLSGSDTPTEDNKVGSGTFTEWELVSQSEEYGDGYLGQEKLESLFPRTNLKGELYRLGALEESYDMYKESGNGFTGWHTVVGESNSNDPYYENGIRYSIGELYNWYNVISITGKKYGKTSVRLLNMRTQIWCCTNL